MTSAENERLVRIGPGTPMGTMLRRYWLPVAVACDVAPGGRPKRIRVLGENLVAFRSRDGELGLIDEACPHRGVSLALGAIDGCALRCPYHGWVIDAAGRVRETPAEPEASTFRDRFRTPAYPLREEGGLLWAYLGPPESEPPPMTFAWAQLPAEQRWIGVIREECNWSQCVDGILDSVHINYLHADAFAVADLPTSVMDGATFVLPSSDGRPRIDVETMPYGFRYATIRKPAIDPDGMQHVRVTQFVAPVYTLVPPPANLIMMQIFVPIDDESTMFFFVKAKTDGPMSDRERELHEVRSQMRPGLDMDADGRKFRARANDWLQGAGNEPFAVRVPGVAMQDMVVQESMGAVFDRSREHLGASDAAVIRFRRLMLESLAQFTATDAAPIGLREPIDYAAIAGEDRLLPVDAPWHSVGAYRSPVLPKKD
jgi:phthalate 4,5-dioxygenase oxygenase subunit